MRICLSTAKTLYYPQGGHLWVFINWALGFRAIGCEVSWLDLYEPSISQEENERYLAKLRQRLRPFGLSDSIVLTPIDGSVPTQDLGALMIDSIDGTDLMFNLRYDLPQALMPRFRRTALLDIDPGMTQQTIASGGYACPKHDIYFTIGEGIVSGACRTPALGVDWHYMPPAVFLGEWPVSTPPANAAFTTVSHWQNKEWMVEPDGTYYENHKKAAFEPFLELPKHVDVPLELSLHLPGDTSEGPMLRSLGWRLSEAHDAAGSPEQFRNYVLGSRGEFSCAKPWYVRGKTGWISDRTPCYLATGRPAVLENTGPCRVLEGVDAGLLRFTNFDEAVTMLQRVTSDYAHHSRAARQLAEEQFDAMKLAKRVLERTL